MAYPGDGRLPVIYVRGFAGSGVDRVVDDPFYGFNEGSVHVRVDDAGEPRFFQFESPLLRLITDEDYQLRVHGDQRAYLNSQDDGNIAANTIWIHRFYDVSASTFGRNPQKFSIEKAAADLFEFVKLVRLKTGAPRVFLVAHSMGGLIARSMLQRVIPDDPDAGGRLDAATTFVERIFTYATPHGGIEFALGGGVLETFRDLTNFQGADIFGPGRMHEYLTPHLDGLSDPADFQPTVMPDDGFPVQRMFCLVGTNPENYGTAFGLSSKAAGARSDGLVQIHNAYVKGAHRAFVHRSHSGRYGIVNSEEGYQNLRRFLFGDLQVRIDLIGLDVQGREGDDTIWQLETSLAIRGLPVLLHEQSTAHYCPIQIEQRRREDTSDRPVPLVTTFLSSTAGKPSEQHTLRHTLKLRLFSLRKRHGLLCFIDHLEQNEDWQDILVIDIAADQQQPTLAWATWNSAIPDAIRDWAVSPEHQLADQAVDTTKLWRSTIALPTIAHRLLGNNAAVQITVVRHTLSSVE
jgi:pimeloyl-ACP methyl ester carboxylesterase